MGLWYAYRHTCPFTICGNISIEQPSNLFGTVLSPPPNELDHCALCFIFRPGKYEFNSVEGKPAFYNIRMKLRIYNVSAADFGTYRCLARNSQGETTGDIELYGKYFLGKIELYGNSCSHATFKNPTIFTARFNWKGELTLRPTIRH